MLERFKIGKCLVDNGGNLNANYNTLTRMLRAHGLLEIQMEHEVTSFDKFLFLSQVHN